MDTTPIYRIIGDSLPGYRISVTGFKYSIPNEDTETNFWITCNPLKPLCVACLKHFMVCNLPSCKNITREWGAAAKQTHFPISVKFVSFQKVKFYSYLLISCNLLAAKTDFCIILGSLKCFHACFYFYFVEVVHIWQESLRLSFPFHLVIEELAVVLGCYLLLQLEIHLFSFLFGNFN